MEESQLAVNVPTRLRTNRQRNKTTVKEERGKQGVRRMKQETKDIREGKTNKDLKTLENDTNKKQCTLKTENKKQETLENDTNNEQR